MKIVPNREVSSNAVQFIIYFDCHIFNSYIYLKCSYNCQNASQRTTKWKKNKGTKEKFILDKCAPAPEYFNNMRRKRFKVP